MKNLLDWLGEVDWQGVDEWIGGVILILALAGFLFGGVEPGDWWAP